jgi:hypothetical protein
MRSKDGKPTVSQLPLPSADRGESHATEDDAPQATSLAGAPYGNKHAGSPDGQPKAAS